MARETLYWDRPFKTVRAGGFETGDIVWFPEGGLNASYNCVDRWVYAHPDKVGTRHLFLLVTIPSFGDCQAFIGSFNHSSKLPFLALTHPIAILDPLLTHIFSQIDCNHLRGR